MTIYISTILLLFIFSVLDTIKSISIIAKKWMVLIAYLLLVAQVGLRWETGTDWNPYLIHFENLTGIISIILSEFEYGYSGFVFLVKLFTNNYTFFLIVHAIIYYLFIFISFKRYSNNLFLSLMVFYTLSMGVMGSNRQLIAIAICIYAVRFIVEKKPIIFFVLVFLAACFHTTAFIFAIYYFTNRDIKPLVFIAILIAAIIIGKTQLPSLLFSQLGLLGSGIAYKTSVYLEGTSEVKLTLIGLVKRLIFLLIFFYNRNRLRNKVPYYNIMLNGYALGIAFYFLFANSLLIMVNRASLYFNIMEPLLICSMVLILKGKENKAIAFGIILIFSFFFFYQSISGYPDLFLPYKGIFINTDYKRFIY